MTTARTHRLSAAVAIAATTGLLISGCAGGAGSAGGGGGGGEAGGGFEFGASQEEVDAAIADLDPVEITYQAGAQSPNSVSAMNGNQFKEYVEER
ncbi:MAG: C4-dicarboxylate ABC transporter substrate-binding protein, partial [Brevibacterium yomogidense]